MARLRREGVKMIDDDRTEEFETIIKVTSLGSLSLQQRRQFHLHVERSELGHRKAIDTWLRGSSFD